MDKKHKEEEDFGFQLESFPLRGGSAASSEEISQAWEKLAQLRIVLAQKKDAFGSISPAVRREIARISDIYRYLFNYIIHKQHGQLVSHAWLKLYEMLSWSHQNKEFLLIPTSTSKYHVFCNAELPGGFIGALNHFIPTVLQSEWEWLACSLNEGSHLPDSFGLRKRYPERWLQNSNMNGDVTKLENLLSMRERILLTFPAGIDLYTSDAGTNVSEDYNAQEELMSLIHLGQVLLGLMVTRKGGNMLVKQFTFFHPFTCSLLSCLSHLFEHLDLVKPETSKPSNSEVYIRCRGFRMGFETFFKSGIYDTMSRLLAECGAKKLRPSELKTPLLWGMDSSVLLRLVKTAERLVNMQTEALEMFQSLSQDITHGKPPNNAVFRLMAKRVSHTFTKKYPILPLHARFWFSRMLPQRKHSQRRKRLKLS